MLKALEGPARETRHHHCHIRCMCSEGFYYNFSSQCGQVTTSILGSPCMMGPGDLESHIWGIWKDADASGCCLRNSWCSWCSWGASGCWRYFKLQKLCSADRCCRATATMRVSHADTSNHTLWILKDRNDCKVTNYNIKLNKCCWQKRPNKKKRVLLYFQ